MHDTLDEIEQVKKKLDEHMNALIGGFNSMPAMEYDKKGRAIGYGNAPLIKQAETHDKIITQATLPGFDKKDIKIKVTTDYIEIKAEKITENRTESKQALFYRKLPFSTKVKEETVDITEKDDTIIISVSKSNIANKKQSRIR